MASSPPKMPALRSPDSELRISSPAFSQTSDVDAAQLRVLADLVDAFHQPVDGLDGVGRGLLVDVEADGEVAVEVAPVVQERLAQLDRGHVAQAQAARAPMRRVRGSRRTSRKRVTERTS